MPSSPIIELIIMFRYGIPIHTLVNPENRHLASVAQEETDSKDLIGALLSAILSFSENLSENSIVKEVKMAKISYIYEIEENLIFFLGYKNDVTSQQEKQVGEFLFELMHFFNENYTYKVQGDLSLQACDFSKFDDYIQKELKSDKWIVERTENEILDEVRELLMDILGPMSGEILANNISLQRVGRIREMDMELLAENLVYEISLLMDPTQAKQIGQEIKTIIAS